MWKCPWLRGRAFVWCCGLSFGIVVCRVECSQGHISATKKHMSKTLKMLAYSGMSVLKVTVASRAGLFEACSSCHPHLLLQNVVAVGAAGHRFSISSARRDSFRLVFLRASFQSMRTGTVSATCTATYASACADALLQACTPHTVLSTAQLISLLPCPP